MLTVSEQANLRELRRELKKLGYSVRKTPKKLNHLGDYTVILNSCGGVVLRGFIGDVQRFLVWQLA